jgi:hypothetical protein
MLEVTNSRGDKVTVDRVDDNITGQVLQRQRRGFSEVAGATVRITNLSTGKERTETTDATGRYDVDVDAAPGYQIKVSASWTDGSGAYQIVVDVITLPQDDGERGGKRGPRTLGEREALLERLEILEQGLVEGTVGESVGVVALTGEIETQLVDLVNSIRSLSFAKQKLIIDRLLIRELLQLLRKIRSIRGRRQPPSPQELFAIVVELFHLVIKLVVKVFLLQGKRIPELPRLGGVELSAL